MAIEIYGIDLGTTYSVISELDDNGNPQPIPNQYDGTNTLPSAVYFPEDSDIPIFGKAAKAEKDISPDRVFEFVKRYIGKPDAPEYTVDGKTYNPVTISALYLKRMKDYAEESGNRKVENVVITCPAYFGHEERTATRQAGEMAGLNVLNIVNEPTAAALCYCSNQFPENQKILVYDLGGGTFDVTLVDFTVKPDGTSVVKVLDTDGNDRLGGIDWDERLEKYMYEQYAEESGIEIQDLDEELKAIINAEAESIKIKLSSLDNASTTIKYDGDRTKISVTREDFENRTADLVNQTMAFVKQLLDKTSHTPDDVDIVLLVGGSTHMPMIKPAVEELFPGKVQIHEPDLAVSKGAVIAANLKLQEIIAAVQEKSQKNETISDDNPWTDLEGFSEDDTTKIIDTLRNGGDLTELTQGNTTGSTISTVNIISRSLGPVVVIDEALVIDNLLFVGQDEPAEAEEVYGTRFDNQEEIFVEVYENMSKEKRVTPDKDIKGNQQYVDPSLKIKSIGGVHLALQPNMPANSPIKVIFKSSSNGLEVIAIDLTSGKQAEVTIDYESALSQEELKTAKEEISGMKTAGQI